MTPPKPLSGESSTLGGMSSWEAAKAWRERYLEAMRRQLRLVEYIDKPDADLEGVARILSGNNSSREA